MIKMEMKMQILMKKNKSKNKLQTLFQMIKIKISFNNNCQFNKLIKIINSLVN